MPTVPVQKYLDNPAQYPAKGVCVVFGEDSFMKEQAKKQLQDKHLTGEDDEFSLTHFEGNKESCIS
ncbi:hypothetical protein FACS189427_02170 [Planctomycetales bacterium]|nr:hypothetical protein FACS189427_02170 [Planctomycetales bacterium]